MRSISQKRKLKRRIWSFLIDAVTAVLAVALVLGFFGYTFTKAVVQEQDKLVAMQEAQK